MNVLIIRTFPDILDPKSYNIQEIGLARALTKKGITCGIVLYNGKNNDTIETIEVLDDNSKIIGTITVYRLHGWNFLKNGIFPGLKKIIAEYDVLQVHEYDQISSWLLYTFPKKPVVLYHGPYYHPFNRGYNLKCSVFDNTFLRIGRKKHNLPCLTKSRAAAEFLQKKGFTNTTAVGVGLDDTAFSTKHQNVEKDSARDAAHFTLLYVGKIEERRNVMFLLDLFSELASENASLRFHIIGNGETSYLEQFLKKAEPLIKSGRLLYEKSATQTRLAQIYQTSELMVFPTNYDIFGMVLLEAAYFGLPVLSSRNGGADMLIDNGKNGIVLNNFEIDSWKTEILKLCENQELYQSIRNKWQAEDQKRLLWDGIADQFILAYTSVLQ